MTLWRAPAKLNLFLHITGQRSDGYHELQTVFQLLDYADTLRIRPTDTSAIELVTIPTAIQIPKEQHLVWRAARLLQEKTSCRRGAYIECFKQIPLGAGLGGGSSNAATALVALNHVWQLGLSVSELAALGLQLGADVPVFVHGHHAWAEGVGEQLTPIALPPRWYVVVIPPCQVATASMFQHPHLPRTTKRVTRAEFWAGQTNNDFEALALELYPDIRRAKRALERVAPARLTGSGSALFVALANMAEVRKIAALLTREGWQFFVARGVERIDRLLSKPSRANLDARRGRTRKLEFT